MPDSGEKHSNQQNERVGFTTFRNRNGADPAVAADALLNERGEAQMMEEERPYYVPIAKEAA